MSDVRFSMNEAQLCLLPSSDLSSQLLVGPGEGVSIAELTQLGGAAGGQAADAATQVVVAAVVEDAAHEMLACINENEVSSIDSAAEFKQSTSDLVKNTTEELRQQGADAETVLEVRAQLTARIEKTAAQIQRNGNDASAVRQGLRQFSEWAGRMLDTRSQELVEAIAAIRETIDPVEISAREQAALQKLMRFTGMHNGFNQFVIAFGDAYNLTGESADSEVGRPSEQLNRVQVGASRELGLYQSWWLKLNRGEKL